MDAQKWYNFMNLISLLIFEEEHIQRGAQYMGIQMFLHRKTVQCNRWSEMTEC